MSKRKASQVVHDWGQHETIYEQTYHVAMGCKQTCRKCAAVLYEDWSETRSCGGIPRIVDQGNGACSKNSLSKDSRHMKS
jgi:hypothetical protein